MEVHRLSHEEAREIREAAAEHARTPRILCWKCKRLTPFHEERCEFCGARFAGSTGGVYSSPRPASRSVPQVPPEDEELTTARRSLLQLFEDLQRVHDVSAVRYDPVRDEETITLFQCPACGRFVSREATVCACGVHFASEPAATPVCRTCGSPTAEPGGECTICRLAAQAEESDFAYACPLCGTEVSADAVRCVCGARFEA